MAAFLSEGICEIGKGGRSVPLFLFTGVISFCWGFCHGGLAGKCWESGTTGFWQGCGRKSEGFRNGLGAI